MKSAAHHIVSMSLYESHLLFDLKIPYANSLVIRAGKNPGEFPVALYFSQIIGVAFETE
jgi:hypothetical protein